MAFHPIDGFLLDGSPSKAAAIAQALAQRSDDEAAQPFYRAFTAVGARAADEALIALRLVLAGKAPADEAVRRLRGAAAVARAAAAADETRLAAALAKDGDVLPELQALRSDLAALSRAARALYEATLGAR